LAGELAGLIDEFVIEGAHWSEVRHLVAEDYDQYWGITTRFLQIAIEQWPAILRERARIDPADRRARAIEREIARLQRGGESDATIVLGSTGTNRATARLMRAIARLDRGAVVLPGLDLTMPEKDWRMVAGAEGEPSFGHPQAALARLMHVLDCARESVQPLGAAPSRLARRMRLVSTAMAPTDATSDWRAYLDAHEDELADGLDGLALIEAADEREEALAIAIRLREALETPDVVAALITPDRSIARRVRAELARWDIAVDDSGGEPLGGTEAGAFARSILRAVKETSDVALLALLAHAAVAPAHDRPRTRHLAGLLEIGVLRATLHDPDAAARIAHARRQAGDWRAHPAAKRISEAEWREIGELVGALESALAPLKALAGLHPIADWTRAHRTCLMQLSAQAPPPDADDFATLAQLLEDTASASKDASSMQLSLTEYCGMFETLVATTAVRGPQRSHARLKILGLLEARLLHADIVVLAGLDEAVWPPQPQTDAFLNRPMRAQLGLTPPERRIGQSAHDFTMAIGAPQVVLTRAGKRGGSPTVASRFLQRLSALAADRFTAVRGRGEVWRELARAIDRPERVQRIRQPEPKPALALRPDALSVTRIEVLRRDPYAIYAERILQLAPLGALDGEPGAAEQGTAIHEVLHELAKRWPDTSIPENALEILVATAREKLDAFFPNAAWRAFRWPSIQSGLAYVVQYEAGRRADIARVFGEVRGKHVLTLCDGSQFTLSATADRIEIARDGGARIVDYKTGQAPSAKQVKAGLNSQLTLEAAMLASGAFKEIGAPIADDALYLKLGGPGGGKRVEIAKNGADFADLVANHWAELEKMLDSYRDPDRGYRSRPLAQWASRYGDYDHLARVKEWSAAGDGGEE
jgi:ATP-dependent helicase/nuclease subunit B